MGKTQIERRSRPRTDRYPSKWVRLTMAKSDDKHRYIWCKHRPECVDIAAHERWDGMSCFYCPQNPYGKKRKCEIDYYEGADR